MNAYGAIKEWLLANRLLALILAAFLVLGITYSVATPIFEAGDEIWHYPFVQYLATGHSLPIQAPEEQTLWKQEGGQAPLYYALSALATFWISTHDLGDRLWYNPHARIGIPLLYGNKNMVIHTSAESFPWHDTTLAVHLIRLLSILLGAATVALTYLVAVEIRPGAKGLAAISAALVAFNPMFLFISASVNNDSLAAMLATLALLLTLRLVTGGATRRQFLALGIVLGLAALSKASDAALCLVAGSVFLYLLWRERSRSIVVGSLVCAALVVAIAGWWYARNWILYGDPLAFNVWVAIAGGRTVPITLASLPGEFQSFRISFWGNFGGVNLIAPDWVYTLLDAFTVLAAIGLLVGWVRGRLPSLLLVPALWFALISVTLIRWTLLTMASQGRLIFPAIGAVSLLLTYGLRELTLPGLRPPIAGIRRFASAGGTGVLNPVLAVFLFGFAGLAPFALIAPAYAFPSRLPIQSPVPNETHIAFEDDVELVGYALPQRSAAPGTELPLTLYWSTRVPITEDLSVYIRLYDADGNVVGRWEAFPGNGMFPTRLWQPGELIVDTYRVPLSPEARGPSVGRVEAGLFRRQPLENLVARDPEGRVVTPTLARFKIAGRTDVQVENPVTYDFGDAISLVGYELSTRTTPGSNLAVKLFWRAQSPMREDYTIFVHLVDGAGKTVAQKDDQPQQGSYPTSFWDSGETVADGYSLAIPADLTAGDYQVQVGVYRARDEHRLSVRDGTDHVNLATVHVGQ